MKVPATYDPRRHVSKNDKLNFYKYNEGVIRCDRRKLLTISPNLFL